MAMGGVGEAMLLGAAMGGGSAALTGGDPLKGALLGGLTGGAGAGISGALSGAAGTAATTALPAALPGAAASALPAATSAIPGAAASALPSAAAPMATSPFLASGPMSAGDAFMSSIGSAPAGLPGGTIAQGVGSFAPPTGIAGLPASSNTFIGGMAKFAGDPMASIMGNKGIAAASALQGALGSQQGPQGPEEYDGPLKRFRFNPETYRPAMFAGGGITDLGGYDMVVGEQPMYQAFAKGGISNLGGYSDYAGGGRMLKGPGDDMSDSIPASIANKQPARLARDEFVVPADVVSGLGNGSSDAGAKHLYAMMDRVRQARTGSKKQGKEIKARRFVPA